MNRIADHWWMFVLRGATSLALAALLLLGGGWGSMSTLALAFGIYAIVDGAGSLAFVLGVRGVPIASYIGRGALGIGMGTLALALPDLSTVALYVLVGVWAIGAGALEIAFGQLSRAATPRVIGFMLAGTVSIGLGLTLLHFPTESVVTLRGMLLVYLVANGAAGIVLGERMRSTEADARHPA